MKVNKKQLKKIIDKTCAAAVKVGMDDIDDFLRVCDTATHKITQPISDKEKIEEIENLIRGFCYAVIEESGQMSGRFARARRWFWKLFVVVEIEKVFLSIK